MCPGKVRALGLVQSLMVVTGVQHAHLECAVFLEMSITPGNLEKNSICSIYYQIQVHDSF